MKYWLILIFAIGLGACQNVQKPEKPKNLIGKDKMIDVLTEAYLTNAARSINNNSILEEGIKMDSLLYSKFGIDSLQFAKSNAYYAADVNMYIDIFKEVETRLDNKVKHLDSIRNAGIKLNDSIPNRAVDEK